MLRLQKPGRLQPWLGPALRGLIAKRFKEQVCRHQPQELVTSWQYCKGCPYMQECPYGQTFEPDPHPEAEIFSGQTDVARRLILRPDFPVVHQGFVGQEIPLRVIFLGQSAIACTGPFWQAVKDAGQDRSTGLGQDNITFDVTLPNLGEQSADNLRFVDLPLFPNSIAGQLPRVKVEFLSPLTLQTEQPDSPSKLISSGKRKKNRYLVVRPAFSDLLRASLRTLGGLFAFEGKRLEADFAGLKSAAGEIRLVDHSFQYFEQRNWSNRRKSYRSIQGIVGCGVYEAVPATLLRWLYWGGNLHVGANRGFGGGSWRLWWSEKMVDLHDSIQDWHLLR